MKHNITLWLKFILVTLCLFASLFLLWIFLPVATDSTLDTEYAILTANDEVITQSCPVDHCDSLRFFYASYANGNKRTEFINAIPDIKIINDEKYYVELTTNKSIHDVISISVEGNILDVDLQDNCYNRVHEEDTSYDYDSGLYVDCTAFDITIHAPISSFRTNTQTILDFDVAKSDETIIDFSFEGTQANIYNIDTKDLWFNCSGSSDVTLSGSASAEATLMVWHDTRVDATDLKADFSDNYVSNQPFGISYIKHDGITEFNPFDLGSILSVALVGFPIMWLCLCIKYIRRLFICTKKNKE